MLRVKLLRLLRAKLRFKFPLHVAGNLLANHIIARSGTSLPVKGSRHKHNKLRPWAEISICRGLQPFRVILEIFVNVGRIWTLQHKKRLLKPAKRTVIYSVKAWIVLYWNSKALNYAVNKQEFAAKLISYVVPVKETLISSSCVAGDWIKSLLKAPEANLCVQ